MRVRPYSTARVMGFLENHVSDPTPRVGMIAVVARDEVDVNVKDTLPGRRAHVHTDVIAVRLEVALKGALLGDQELHARGHLLRGEIKKVRTVPEGNDQRVSGADRIGVPRGVGETVPPGDVARDAEQAGPGHVLVLARAGARAAA